MHEHQRVQLVRHILRLSEADTFAEAALEWRFDHIYCVPGRCPCGVRIVDHCVIRNVFNHRTTYVGNICVNHFFGIDVDHLFIAFKRIDKSPEKPTTIDLIDLAHRMGVLSEWELNFARDTDKIAKPTPRQLACRIKINSKITSSQAFRGRIHTPKQSTPRSNHAQI